MTIALILLIPIALAAALLCIRNWRIAIPGVILWTLVEGAARKWGLPQYQGQIYLLKDVVLLAAYVGFITEYRRINPSRYMDTSLIVFAGIYIIFLLLLLFNPGSPSLVLSLVGLKNHLTYLPLALVVPALIHGEQDLYKFLRWFIFATIIISLIGLYQFTQPADAWINLSVSFDNVAVEAVSRFGEQGEGDFRYGRVRTSGTFSYIGGMITFVILVVPMISAMLFTNRLTPMDRRWAYLALMLSLGASFTTGARTPIFVLGLGLPILFGIAVMRGLLSVRLFLRLIGAAVFVGLGATFIFNDAIAALIFRSENADSSVTRLLSPIIETMDAFEFSPIFGTGLGTNSNAAATIMRSPFSWWLDGHYFELESARIMQEVGFFGFILAYALRIYIVYLGIRYAFRHTNPYFIALCLAATFFFAVHLVLFIVNNPLAAVYYYTLLGMVLATGKLASDQSFGVKNAWRATTKPAQLAAQ
ncbi:MAG: O-antigen ligase family protein [Sphingopyxis sp.]